MSWLISALIISASLIGTDEPKSLRLIGTAETIRGSGAQLGWSHDDSRLFLRGLPTGAYVFPISQSAGKVAIGKPDHIDGLEVLMTADGRRIFVSNHESIVVYTAPEVKRLHELRIRGKLVAISGTGEQCAVVLRDELRLIDVPSEAVAATFTLSKRGLHAVSFRGPSRVIGIEGTNHSIPKLGSSQLVILGADDDQLLSKSIQTLPRRPISLAVSRDEHYLAIGYDVEQNRPPLTIIDTRQPDRTIQVSRKNQLVADYALAFSPQNDTLYCAGASFEATEDGSPNTIHPHAHLWACSLDSSHLVADHKAHEGYFLAVSRSWHSDVTATVDDKGTIQAWTSK